MSFDTQDWELIKKHVADLVQAEVEAALAAHLAVGASIVHRLRKKGLMEQADVENLLNELDVAASSLQEQVPAIAHHLSLASQKLRNALVSAESSQN